MPKRFERSLTTTSDAAFRRVIEDFSSGPPSGPHSSADHAVWLACLSAGIGGLLAAHRSLPNPELVLRYSTVLADRGVEAARLRRKGRKTIRGEP